MYFGEIVEPSSRALIEDEYEEYPDYVEPEFDFIGDNPENIPTDLQNLIFVESPKVLKVFNKCVLNEEEKGVQLISKLPKETVKIHRKTPSTYVISYKENEGNLISGQLVEKLSGWIKRAKKICTITSAPLATLQNNTTDSFSCVIRALSTKPLQNFTKLEAPNLITGIGANVLTYCIHNGLNCTSFIAYMDSTPIDSLNTNPLINLAKQLQLNPKPFGQDTESNNSNLYM